MSHYRLIWNRQLRKLLYSYGRLPYLLLRLSKVGMPGGFIMVCGLFDALQLQPAVIADQALRHVPPDGLDGTHLAPVQLPMICLGWLLRVFYVIR